MPSRNHLLELSRRHPMGNCCSTSTADYERLQATAATTGKEATSSLHGQLSAMPPPVRASDPSSQHRANPGHGSPSSEDVPKTHASVRPRSDLTPKKPTKEVAEDLPPVPSHRTRVKSTFASSSRNTSAPVSAGERCRRWSA